MGGPDARRESHALRRHGRQRNGIQQGRRQGISLRALVADLFQQFDKGLRDNNYWRGSERADFARAVTDIITDFTAMHPFRKGMAASLRIFLQELAREAGHALDFSVISRERMRHAAISLHELDDTTFYRGLIVELLDPERVAALKAAIAFFEAEKFPWNDYEIATPEPGQTAELVLAGIGGPLFHRPRPLADSCRQRCPICVSRSRKSAKLSP